MAAQGVQIFYHTTVYFAAIVHKTSIAASLWRILYGSVDLIIRSEIHIDRFIHNTYTALETVGVCANVAQPYCIPSTQIHVDNPSHSETWISGHTVRKPLKMRNGMKSNYYFAFITCFLFYFILFFYEPLWTTFRSTGSSLILLSWSMTLSLLSSAQMVLVIFIFLKSLGIF